MEMHGYYLCIVEDISVEGIKKSAIACSPKLINEINGAVANRLLDPAVVETEEIRSMIIV